MRAYVGITDFSWFRFLSARPHLDEINFWKPGGKTGFRALSPGELFLFKLHAPRQFIVGGGYFAHFGRDYYALHGRRVSLPAVPEARPEPTLLRWHSENLYLG